AGRLHVLLAQEVGDGLDHRRGGAEVDVDVAVVHVGRVHVGGDVALARVARSLVDHHHRVGEVRQRLRGRFEAVDLDHVGIGVDAVDQVDRERAAAGGDDLVEHREEGGEAGATGQHQDRAGNLAQV